jgi:hypothetical protein
MKVELKGRYRVCDMWVDDGMVFHAKHDDSQGRLRWICTASCISVLKDAVDEYLDRQMEPESSQKLPVGVPFSERSEAKPAQNCDTCRHEDLLEEKAPYCDCHPSATNPWSTWQAKTSEECPKMTHLNCGRLRIPQCQLADYPDVVATLFGLLRFVPTHIESELYQPGVRYSGVAEYLGDSPFFASLVNGDRIPLYEATVADGRIAVHTVEEK